MTSAAMTRPILAWHWTAGDRLRDGSRVRPGRWLVHDGPLALCRRGLHASRRCLNALYYAPGDTVWRVEIAGDKVEDSDKLVCARRRPLWCVDAEALLRAFARRCALDVIHLWSAPLVVVRWLRTGDESLREAAGAAREAAWEAREAAWEAAWAARAAREAGAAARSRQEQRLVAMIHAARRKR